MFGDYTDIARHKRICKVRTSIYDLLFVVLFLATVAAIVYIMVLAAIKRPTAAWKLLLGVGAVWCIYLVVLAATDLAAQQLVIPAGKDRCFDEMCFAVVDLQILPAPRPDHRVYVVTLRATSHSLGRTQAEGGLRARIYADKKYFNVSEPLQNDYELKHGRTAELTRRLAPGESVNSVLVFDVPEHATKPGLTLDHGFTPGYFVIGESPFFHEPDILQFPQDQ